MWGVIYGGTVCKNCYDDIFEQMMHLSVHKS